MPCKFKQAYVLPLQILLAKKEYQLVAMCWKNRLVLEHVCRPKMVVVMNANLPDMAGWVREKLMLNASWAELVAKLITT